ncbi:Rho-type gtpase-activating protein [Vermiconidia calcicola]|uniref:Rho-type gtpase-activating protein n=1 Tax=Vermiconidia calcicola TaxID=1690605 RepID=A0ACC3NR67_9PEZI|nr:Rho-type gtpase-activating protein [Vermiconidia calcicola]
MAELESPYLESPMEQEDVIFPCKGCGDILEEGKAFELAGNRWHIDCFRCNTCGTLLDSDANLLLLGDGSLICNNCTYSCNACGNKIEDLAILTGDQAFCSACFRCRNCKKKIENLRYARTSQGIFCMSCHEALMARRRKRTKTNPKPLTNGTGSVKEKALPSLPPGAAPLSAYSPEAETPPSEVHPGTPGARSPPERNRSRRGIPSNSIKRDVSPLSDDARRDGPLLPASTYGVSRSPDVSRDSEDGEEQGYLPMAFDPNPVAAPPPVSRREIPRAIDQSPPARNDNRSRDYFGSISSKTTARDVLREQQRPVSLRSVSTEREPVRQLDSTKASPHIMYQAKGRDKKVSGSNTPASGSTVASPAITQPQDRTDRAKQQQTENGSLPVNKNEGFRLQEVPKSRRAGSRTSSKHEGRSPALDSPATLSPIDSSLKDERNDKPSSNSPISQHSANSSVNPFDDPKRKEGGNASAAPVPPKQADRPVRGDSLTPANRKTKASTPEMPTSNLATLHDRKVSTSSVPSVFADAQSTLSRENSRSKGVGSPAVRTSFDAPPPRNSSRSAAPMKAVPSEEFTAPRAPPPAPPVVADRHRKDESVSTLQSNDFVSESPISPSLRSAGLPKQSMDHPFSMEDEMFRIMHGSASKRSQDTSASVLRKVSNVVKHGRSFSDRGLHSAGKSSSNGAIEISSPMTISSPLLASPRDSNEQLVAQLKRAQKRIAELESEVNRFEEKVDSSAEIKAANNELREKRTTMIVLDTQREMVVRELEVMTEHLSRAKDSNKPLDLNTLKSEVLKDFAESLQRLKDHMSAQIEDLMHRRNELTEEIGNLIQMKDKGFQEYESLSSKNAQLNDMNSQIMHRMQDIYQSNRGANGAAPTANGLGIYHPGAKVESGPSEIRNLNMVSTDSSLPNLLHETEAEPATVLTGPQVVNIRKGQPKKFNWRKGGEKMAKNVTKGIKGAFVGERKDGEPPYNIGMPYNQTHQAIGGSEQSSLAGSSLTGSRQGLDANRPGFGFFGQKNTGKAGGLGNMKNNSSNNLVVADASVLFGSELEARCEFEKRIVPSIVSRCIEEVESRGMDVEGIYRKSGGSGQVKQVQQGFEKDGNLDISDPDLDIHAVTSALKQYFRKLPTPLITFDAYESLLEAGRLQDKEKQALALRVAMSELPEHHRDCLEYLIQHLARVMGQESSNLMTPLNLAVVFAPTIMRPLSIEREMSDMQAQRTALQALLDQHTIVFADE